ncbi:unknown [Alistipes sp. CAG:29]|nr:unknown [Alistipes sp. CAG:29]
MHRKKGNLLLGGSLFYRVWECGYLPSPIFSISALVSGLWPRKRT